MVPPPPKLGQRDLFNDSFFSFLKRKDKSQPKPAPPPGGPQSPDFANPPNQTGHANPRIDESVGEKKALLHEGHRILDSTKDLLERNQHFFRKETLKRLRKEAAKLTKGAPAKNKLPKKSLGEVSGFQESAKVLYQEVDNIIREMDRNQGEYPGLAVAQQGQGQGGRSGSESPPPLPRKPPSPKVTFPADMKPDSNDTLARHQSVRHGYELSDPSVPMSREDTAKHRYRDKEAEVGGGLPQKDYDRSDRRVDDRYRDRDDRYRSRYAPERSRNDYYRDRERDRDRDRSYYHSSRSRRYDDRDRDRYRDRDRDYRDYRDRDRDPERYRDRYRDRERERDRGERERDRDRDKDRDRERERERERDRDKDRGGDRDRDRNRDRDRHRDKARDKESGEEPTNPDQTPQRVVHPDIPLSATPSGSNVGIPVNPTIVPYPVDEEGRRRDKEKYSKDREREREHPDWDRDRNRARDRSDRDRDRERYSSRRDEEYVYGSRDRHKSSRRYDDEHRGSGRSRRDRDREREGDRGGHQEPEREKDREKEREHHSSDSPPSPTDPNGSKFQEVFSPPEHASGILPSHSEAAAWNG